MRPVGLLSLSALSFAIGCGAQAHPTGLVDPEPTRGPQVSFEEVLTEARRLHPAAAPVYVERQRLDGAVLLEVELVEGGQRVELFFDPVTGAVAREGEEVRDPGPAVSPEVLAAAEADPGALARGLALARERFGGAELVRVVLTWDGGALAVDVEAHDGGAAQADRLALPIAPTPELAPAPPRDLEEEEEEELIE